MRDFEKRTVSDYTNKEIYKEKMTMAAYRIRNVLIDFGPVAVGAAINLKSPVKIDTAGMVMLGLVPLMIPKKSLRGIKTEYRMKKTGQKDSKSEVEDRSTRYSGERKSDYRANQKSQSLINKGLGLVDRNISRAKALAASGYSQAEIAEKLGVSQSTVSDYINGELMRGENQNG